MHWWWCMTLIVVLTKLYNYWELWTRYSAKYSTFIYCICCKASVITSNVHDLLVIKLFFFFPVNILEYEFIYRKLLLLYKYNYMYINTYTNVNRDFTLPVKTWWRQSDVMHSNCWLWVLEVFKILNVLPKTAELPMWSLHSPWTNQRVFICDLFYTHQPL